MSDGELPARLAEWLESSGRALELRTARECRRYTANLVTQSSTYDDLLSEKQREGDVLAVYSWPHQDRTLALKVAIECKSSAEKPWVAFYDGRDFKPKKPSDWFTTSMDLGSEPDLDGLVEEWLMNPDLSTARLATHAVSAFGKDSQNLVNEAARQVFSFARYLAKQRTVYAWDGSGNASRAVVVPVVVTSAPLYACELDASGGVGIEAVDGFDMSISIEGSRRRRIYVRNETSFRRLLRGVNDVRYRFGGSA